MDPWYLLASSGALGELILGNKFFPFGAAFPCDVKVALWMWQTCLVVSSLCEIRLVDGDRGTLKYLSKFATQERSRCCFPCCSMLACTLYVVFMLYVHSCWEKSGLLGHHNVVMHHNVPCSLFMLSCTIMLLCTIMSHAVCCGTIMLSCTIMSHAVCCVDHDVVMHRNVPCSLFMLSCTIMLSGTIMSGTVCCGP